MNIQKIKIGSCWFYHDADSEPGQKQLYHGIGYEHHIRKELERLIPQARCFLDIGANAGIHSVNAKDINPNVHVVAVEVSPKNVSLICRTVLENRFSGFDIFPIGISSKSGVVGIGDIDNSCCSLDNIDNYDNVWPCHTLSMINIPSPDVIKIDVEGLEFNVLKSLSHFLVRGNKLPTIILEYCPIQLKLFGSSRSDPLVFLERIGYKFTMLDHQPNIRKTFDSSDGIISYFDSLNMFITDIMAHE